MQLNKVKRVTSALLGELPLKENGATFKPAAFKRETQEAEVAENVGFVETPQHAELVMTLQAYQDPGDFAGIRDDSLTIYLAGGAVHMMSKAWVIEPTELGNGELKVTYHSGTSQKIQ